MSDRRLRAAWKAWIENPSDENAQRYCAEHARALGGPDRLDVSIADLDASPLTKQILDRAAYHYGVAEKRRSEVRLGSLAHMTEAHFKAMSGCGVKTVKAIGQIFASRGHPLAPGNPGTAASDLQAARALRRHRRDSQRAISFPLLMNPPVTPDPRLPDSRLCLNAEHGHMEREVLSRRRVRFTCHECGVVSEFRVNSVPVSPAHVVPRACENGGCEQPAASPAVYCSNACAQADA